MANLLLPLFLLLQCPTLALWVQVRERRVGPFQGGHVAGGGEGGHAGERREASWCITAEGSSVPAGTTVMRWLTVTVFASSSSGSADGGAPKVDSNSAGSSTFYYYYD